MDKFILIYVYILITLFGACIGSFLNVVIYRLPKGLFFKEQRSYCPLCKKKLKAYDLIPVLSYILLGGKCRYCKAKISARYPAVEAFCGGIAAFCFTRYGFDIKTVAAFGISVILLALSMIDIDTMELPDSLVISLVPFALLSVAGWSEVSVLERVIGFFAVSVPIFLIAYLIEGAFGGGDIKLIAVCGFILGWKGVLLAFVISLILGGVAAIVLVARKKAERKSQIAFGPYLCAGIATAMFFSGEILDWYFRLPELFVSYY